MAFDFSKTLSDNSTAFNAPAPAVGTDAAQPVDLVNGDLGALLAAPEFVDGSVKRRNELYKSWEKTGFTGLMAQAGWTGNAAQVASARKEARAASKEFLKPAERSWTEAVTDPVIGATAGVVGFIKSGADLLGGEGGEFSNMGGKGIQDLHAMQSDKEKDTAKMRAEQSAAIDARDDIGGFSKEALKAYNYLRNLSPAAIGELAGSTLPGGGLARAVGAGGAALGASEKLATGVGASVAGVVDAAGGGAGGAFDEVMRMTAKQLQESPDYRELLKTLPPDQAKEALAHTAASRARLAGIPVGLLLGPLGAEAAIAKWGRKAGPATGNGALTAAKHAAGEATEEGLTQAAQNFGVQLADPSLPLYQDVGPNMAAGALMGGVAGAVAQGSNAPGVPAPAPTASTPVAPEPVAAQPPEAVDFTAALAPLTPEEKRAFATSAARAELEREDPVADVAASAQAPTTTPEDVAALRGAHAATAAAAIEAELDAAEDQRLMTEHAVLRDAEQRKAALNGLIRLADDDAANLEVTRGNAARWLDWLVSDVSSRGLDEAATDELFAREFEQRGNAWQPVLSAPAVDAARGRASANAARAQAIVDQLPEFEQRLWTAEAPLPTIPDRSAAETAAALEPYIKERIDAASTEATGAQAIESGSAGNPAPAGGQAGTEGGAGTAGTGGTAGSADRGLADPQGSATGQPGPLSDEPGAAGAAESVGGSSPTATANDAGQQPGDRPAQPTGEAGGAGQRSPDREAAAGGGDLGQPGGAGESAGGLTPAAKRWEMLAWRDGAQVPFAALNDKAREAWSSAVGEGEGTREFAQELMKAAKRPTSRDRVRADEDAGRPITPVEREAARREWDESAGYAAEQYGDMSPNDQIPYDDLERAQQDEWAVAHRDPAVDGAQRDGTAQNILRRHARNERTQRINAVAERAIAAEEASNLNRNEARRSAAAVIGDSVALEATSPSDVGLEPPSLFATTPALPVRPISLEAAQKAIDKALLGLFQPPEVVGARTPASVGIQVPASIVPMGLTDQAGRIFIFSDAHATEVDLVRTVFHELLHRGVKTLFSSNADYVRAMVRLAVNDPLLRRYAARWEKSADGVQAMEVLRATKGPELSDHAIANYKAQAIEEGLADIAEELRVDKRAGMRLGATVSKTIQWLAQTADKLGLGRLADSLRGLTYNESEQFVSTAILHAGDQIRMGGARYASPRVAAALAQVTTRARPAGTHAEWLTEMTTGEPPRVSFTDGLLDATREKLWDSTAPFLAMIGDRASPVYRAFNRMMNQSNVRMMDAQQRFEQEVSKPVAAAARAMGLDAAQLARDVGNYALARYAPEGNNELLQRHQDTLTDAQAVVASLRPLVQADPQHRGYRSQLAEAEADVRVSQDWIDRHADVDHLVRDAQAAPELQRQDTDRFIGGLTTAEAEAGRQAIEQRYGAGAVDLVQLADRLTGFMQGTANNAIAAGAIQPAELVGFSKSKNWIPTTGEGEETGTESELSFNSGTGGLRDHQREGRSSIPDNPIESVMRKALALERQSAVRAFAETLAAHDGQMGIHVVQSSDQRKGIPFKRDAVSKVTGDPYTERMKIVFDSEKAMDAVLGANRQRADRVWMHSVGKFTRYTAYAVTRLVPTFAPISGFKDVVERVINISANAPVKVAKARLLADTLANYASLPNFMAAVATIRGTKPPTAAMQAATELLGQTGFLTRNTQLSTDLENLSRDIAKAAGGQRRFAAIRDLVHGWNEAFERSAQLSVYRALRAQGLAPDIAADTMLEAMNLNKTGAYAPVMQAFYPFFGARMTGGYQVLRNMTTVRGWATLGTAVGAGMLLYALADAMGGDGEDDEEGLANSRTDSISGMTIARSIPLWFGGQSYGKVPVPYGTGFVGWNIAVALSRLGSGAVSATHAGEQIFTAMMDETSPFSPSPADITKYPGFWTAKTLAPDILKKLINVAANRNDFGGALGVAVLRANVPEWMQGSRKTNETWKEMASGMAAASGGMLDATPEKWREMTSVFLPLAQQVVKANDAELEASGDSAGGVFAGARALAGGGRLVGKLDSTTTAAFYQLKQQAEGDYQQAFQEAGRRDPSKRGERMADIAEWLESTSLSDAQKARVLAIENYNSALNKLLKNKPDPDDVDAQAEGKASLKEIQQDFLREVKS